MKYLFTSIFLTITASVASAADTDTHCYEMRTYYAAEGKLDALHARFRDHTTKLFEKHGMVNIGYWVPQENPERKLIYILSYPDRPAREKSWKAFLADPDWKQAAKESEKNGKLVDKFESRFLKATDYSPAVAPLASNPTRAFELRIYTASTGNLSALDDRFRNHTIGLFNKHGMQNFGYWHLMPDQPGADKTLIYILAHKSKEAGTESFKNFRTDPTWVTAKEASEKKAGGSLTVTDGVVSVYMNPTDYSATQ